MPVFDQFSVPHPRYSGPDRTLYVLSFAAGAMIFVVIVEEVIPRSQRGHNTDLATMGTMLGFALMMVLDVVLG